MQTKDILVAVLVLCIVYFAHANYSQLQEQIKVLTRENSILRVFVPSKDTPEKAYTPQQQQQQATQKSPFPPREDETYGMGLPPTAPLTEQYQTADTPPDLPTYG